MSTATRDPKKLLLTQAHLALNGWVGASPIALGVMGSHPAPRERQAAICNTAPATEGHPAPLICEPVQTQD